MGLLQDFKAFALKGNVVDLAVAVVIGGAFGKIVTALVNDIVMPLVNVFQRGGEWRTWTVTSLSFKVGDFLGAVVDFFLIAAVLFLVVTRLVNRVYKREAPPVMKGCPECLEQIPAAARRCRACTAVQPDVAAVA